MNRYSSFLVLSLLVILWSGTLQASDYYSLLDVRYEMGLKKTFLGGPFRGKSFCEELNQIVWDNVRPGCGSCRKEAQYCDKWSQLNEPYLRVMNRQAAPFIYAIVGPKNRIVFSGAARAVVERECEWTARNFRANGYPDARCVR